MPTSSAPAWSGAAHASAQSACDGQPFKAGVMAGRRTSDAAAPGAEAEEQPVDSSLSRGKRHGQGHLHPQYGLERNGGSGATRDVKRRAFSRCTIGHAASR